MNKSGDSTSSWLRVLQLIFAPLLWTVKFLDKHFISFIRGRVLRDDTRVYSLRFVWYSDSIYLHPMIWGSFALYLLASTGTVTEGTPLAQAEGAEVRSTAVPADSSDVTSATDGQADAVPVADGTAETDPPAAPIQGSGIGMWELSLGPFGTWEVSLGWFTMIWFLGLGICYLTTMHNFNVLRAGILLICVFALLGGSYYTTHALNVNLMTGLINHLESLGAAVTPGFYIVSTYFFTGLIICEVLWAWLFHRVEIDESYVYEFRFLMGTAREPIFARGLRRETKDLLELLTLGAADITHRTKNGVKRFPNVPLASLWLGLSFDKMLDYRRQGQIELEKQRKDRDDSDQARLQDAVEEISEDWQESAGDSIAEDVDPDSAH